jgi:hypothetical protein
VKRYVHRRTGVPAARTTVSISGERQIAAFERMCQVTGRTPAELASDIVTEAVWELIDTPGMRLRVREARRWRRERMETSS